MKCRHARPRVGVLALTLELYERIAPELRQQRERWLKEQVLPAISLIADVRFSQVVCRREDVERTVTWFDSEGSDAIVIICLTYSASQIVLPALQRTRLPIIIWNIQELSSINEAFSMELVNHNHGVHGTQDLANVLLRSNTPFHYITSHLNNADGLKELEDFLVAAETVASLRHCRLGLMGYPFPGMGDFAVDTTHLVSTLGCSWESLPVGEYIQRAQAVPKLVSDRLVAEYRHLYDVAGDLTEAELDATARAEISLRSIVSDRRLDGLSYQFLVFGEDDRTETLPFVAVSRMMADGIGFAGEGDIVGAAGTWLLNKLHGPASFSEIFTIDFTGNSLLLSHMGEANTAMARKDRKIPLVAQPTSIIRTRLRQLSLINCFEPGSATLCALAAAPHGRWRLVVSWMEIEDFGPLTSLPVPHCKIKNQIDVRQWLTAYAMAGGPHHHAICFGDARPRLKIVAQLLDADYCEV